MRLLPVSISTLLPSALVALGVLSCQSATANGSPTTALEPRGPVFAGTAAAGLHLTASTFYPTIHDGAWLIEFYSPYCHHCQQFAPTWDDAAKMSAHLADSSSFRMARVDCIAQGDMCMNEKVKWFPTVRLYIDGVSKEEYKGNRSYDDLMSFIKAKAEEYRKALAAKLASVGAA